MNTYQDFLSKKKMYVEPVGIDIQDSDISPVLFAHQRDIVKWACHNGRGAIFADVGLGKTAMQLEWSRLMNKRTIIIAPLSVSQQTVEEAKNLLGIDIKYIRSTSEVSSAFNIYITNYEMIEHIDPKLFDAVVLDESSILKSLTGKTKKLLIKMFADTPYKLACTATPAPNDITEIGNHAEFLGVMTQNRMMATWFVYDSGLRSADGNEYRLKAHAHDDFYKWLASWAVALKKPSDLGYSDKGYNLPPVNYDVKTVHGGYTPEGMLDGFGVGAISAVEAKKVRKVTIDKRAQLASEIINNSNEQWVIWCDLNQEGDTLEKLIHNSVNVHGSMDMDDKVKHIHDFVHGKLKVLITKTSIAGMGINMQNCSNMMFFGLNYSWEQFYQAVGRIHRFGQKSEVVNVVVLTSEEELPIWEVVQQKGLEASKMTKSLIEASAKYQKANLRHEDVKTVEYATDVYKSRSGKFEAWLGDSCELMQHIEDESVDLSVYSPPFGIDLFTYSNMDRDLSNCSTLDEFFAQYQFIIEQNYRILKAGRLCVVHVADGRTLVGADGFKGRRDFSGMVIEAYQRAGFVFWQRNTIDKNPQAQAIRMKDSGLLFKTLKTDSTNLAGGHPDYLLIFKKPGENQVPVTPYQNGDVTANDWIEWAHPVWKDIRETNTLNASVARSDKDEKHVCPLQLDVIERCIRLWTNPNEVVFSPFMGIGSEGHEAVRLGRRFLGIELKPEYFKVAVKNIGNAEMSQRTLFDGMFNEED